MLDSGVRGAAGATALASILGWISGSIEGHLPFGGTLGPLGSLGVAWGPLRSFGRLLRRLGSFEGALGALWGSFGELWASFGGPLGVLWASFGGLVGVLRGSLGVWWASWGALWGSMRGRSASWSLRGRFPGFSGKFWEAFWLHFGIIFH